MPQRASCNGVEPSSSTHIDNGSVAKKGARRHLPNLLSIEFDLAGHRFRQKDLAAGCRLENGEASQRFTSLTVNLEPHHSLVKELLLMLSAPLSWNHQPPEHSAKRGRGSRKMSAAIPFEFATELRLTSLQLSYGSSRQFAFGNPYGRGRLAADSAVSFGVDQAVPRVAFYDTFILSDWFVDAFCVA